MKRISYWAKNNPQRARITIVLLHIALAILAFYVGRSFHSIHFTFSRWFLVPLLGIFLLAAALYPRGRKKPYRNQKICDFILGSCSYLLVCLFFNQFQGESLGLVSSFASIPVNIRLHCSEPNSTDTLSLESGKEKSGSAVKLSKSEKKKLRSELRKDLKAFVSGNPEEKIHIWAKIALIILSLAASAGLLYLLALLSCSIACGGAEFLALFILILGTISILFLLIQVLRKIIRWGTPKGTKPENPGTQTEK
jgi:hypothetical protein